VQESDTILTQLRELCDSQQLAVLATDSDSRPYASLVAFAASSDLRRLFFATTRDTRKYANLRSNSRIALLVDNRVNRVDDFTSAVAVTVLGDSRELSGTERADAERLYLIKHPHLREFVSSPSCALVEVAVSSLYLVSRFQNVTEFHFHP
jgi:heme iron utilization protein